MALSPKQEQFAREYLVDLNATRAAIRAGYSRKTASSQAERLLRNVEVAARIAELMAERAVRTQVQADEVLRQLWAIATADPNELIELRRECCRFCYGAGHHYQRTPAEQERNRREWEMARSERGGKNLGDFDEAGGVGFDPRKDPHPSCPECHGEGVERPFPKDTRWLSPSARLLYAGVKVTRGGLEIRMLDQLAALVNVGKHLGMFTDRKLVEHSGPGREPIPVEGEREHTGTVGHQPDPASFRSFMDAVLAEGVRPVPEDGKGQPVD